MKISGLQKLTLLDFPGRLAATVFLGGCNFRCPFCHNASLVLAPAECENIGEEELFSFLASRKGKLTGVCVTGGEPTLYPTLKDFIKRIKEMGLAVKLDTNGTNPELLSELIEEGTARIDGAINRQRIFDSLNESSGNSLRYSV